MHPRLTHRGIRDCPPFRGRPGNVEEHGSVRDRPASVDDEFPNPQALDRSQSSISVGHEGLLVDETEPEQIHSRPVPKKLSQTSIPRRGWCLLNGAMFGTDGRNVST